MLSKASATDGSSCVLANREIGWHARRSHLAICVWQLTCAIVLALVMTSCRSCTGVQVYDINPDTPNGQPLSAAEVSTSGLTLRVDGNAGWLYAVTLNAGVYRSLRGLYDGGWVQLNNSPSKAYSLAVDRNDVRHVVVGERDGDNANPNSNTSGVWESVDGGNTWDNYFDPRSLNSSCTSQAVPSVAISINGTAVAATSCGVAFHPKGGQWAYARLPSGFPSGAVTAVVASETRVWARDAQYNLIVSDNNAQTFAFATQKSHGSVQVGATGDDHSLAAFDSLAVMICLGATVNNGTQNLTQLLMYDAERDAWIDQTTIKYSAMDATGNLVTQTAQNGNGNFSIGRRFVKTYVIGKGSQWGNDRQLFVSNAQEVFRATSRNNDGTFNFERVAGTGSSNGGSIIANWSGTLHRDLWDFHLAPDGTAAWVASDGGVAETLLNGNGWHTRSHSLNIQHVESMFVSEQGGRAAYVTQDNDGWIRSKPGSNWSTLGGLGDGNYVVGDRGNPNSALLVRDVGTAVLTGFNAKLPTSKQNAVYGITLNNDKTFLQTPNAFKFIQTRKGEQFPNPLDAVMLTKLPFGWKDTGGTLHSIIENGQPFALIRNQNFEANPDVNVGQGSGWVMAADNLPPNPIGFWVTSSKTGPGGHSAPIYYLLASSGGTPILYISKGPSQGTVWAQVSNQPTNIVAQSLQYRNGPVFVNPYDADVVYVLTTTGVVFTTNATSATPMFTTDTVLSSLLTANGTYSFASGFPGGNSTNVDQAFHNGGWPTETLSDMAFDYDDPSHLAAASPFTGAFANIGNGWLDLGQSLPKPLSPVVSVAISGTTLTVSTMGRGILVLERIDKAKTFVRSSKVP